MRGVSEAGCGANGSRVKDEKVDGNEALPRQFREMVINEVEAILSGRYMGWDEDVTSRVE